jgi:hypothetical protein
LREPKPLRGFGFAEFRFAKLLGIPGWSLGLCPKLRKPKRRAFWFLFPFPKLSNSLKKQPAFAEKRRILRGIVKFSPQTPLKRKIILTNIDLSPEVWYYFIEKSKKCTNSVNLG